MTLVEGYQRWKVPYNGRYCIEVHGAASHRQRGQWRDHARQLSAAIRPGAEDRQALAQRAQRSLDRSMLLLLLIVSVTVVDAGAAHVGVTVHVGVTAAMAMAGAVASAS